MGTEKTQHPSFLVTINDHDYTKKLRIPTNFIQHLNEIAPFESILRTTSSGRCWCIKVKSEEENLFFGKGWSVFVQDNFLELGDSLVLKYKGSKFYVKIYGKNGCEKVLPSSNVDVEHKDDEGTLGREFFSSGQNICGSCKCGEPKRRTPVDNGCNKEFPLSKAKGKCTKSCIDGDRKYDERNKGRDSVGPKKNICGSRKCVQPKKKIAFENDERTEAPEAACSFQEECPYFILSWKQEMKYQVKVPDSFLKEIGEALSDIVVVKDPIDRVWSIGLRKADGEVWFQKDWEDFIEHQSICEHFLFFRYNGNSQFYVFTKSKISASEMRHWELDDSVHHEEPNDERCQSRGEKINKSACGTKVSYNKKRRLSRCSERLNSRYKKKQRGDDQGKVREISNLGESNETAKQGREESTESIGHDSLYVEEKDMSSDDSLDELDESSQDKQRSEVLSPYQGNERTGSSGHEWIEIDSDESPSVGKRKSYSSNVRAEGKKSFYQVANEFNSEHPFFVVLIRKTYISRGYLSNGYLHVPIRFARRNIAKGLTTVKLLRDSKTWSVNCCSTGTSTNFMKGWGSFTRDTGLLEGDVCVFELINRSVGMMKVSIFRVIQNELTLI